VQELYRYGVPTMAFVLASELLHDREYKSALQKLLTGQPRLQSYASLAQTSLNPNLENELRKRNLIPFAPVKEKERQAEVERFRLSLVRAGLKESEATDYALAMAAKSPECLGQINNNFLTYVRRDYAQTQVEAFAKRFLEKMKKGQKPDDASELTDVKDSYLRTITDPWGNRLVLTGGRVVSPGEDRKLDTPDDIRSDLL
jgi:hypothetical protein